MSLLGPHIGPLLAFLVGMLTIDLLAASASTGLAYLLSYGGFRGPVDWLSHTTTHHGRRDQPRIALTFDDGPDPAHTPALLDALAELGVKATFFVVGEEVDANPELVRRMVAEGHELGNHTYSHRYLPLATTRRVARELAATDAAIVRATGITPTLMRPPYGGRTPFTLRACNQMGKSAVLWDVNSFDWRGGSAEEVAQLVMYLCDDKASFITGQAIRIDGGLGITIQGSKK